MKLSEFIFEDIPYFFEDILDFFKVQYYSLRAPNIKKLASKKEVDKLIKALQYHEKYSDIPNKAGKALGEIGDERAVLPLINTLKKSSSFYKDQEEALLKIGEPSIIPFINSLDNSNIRSRAYDFFRKIDYPVIDPLIQSLTNENIRWSVIKFLGWFKEKKAVECIIEFIKDDDINIREITVESLKNISDERTIDLIKDLLTNKSFRVRESVLQVLSVFKNQKAKDIVYLALKDEVWSVRKVALESLSKMDWEPSNISQKVMYLLVKKNITDIVNIGNPAIEPLLETFEVNDSTFISDATDCLAMIGGEKAINSLILAQKHESQIVRKCASFSLGKIRNKSAVEPLIEFLNQEHRSENNRVIETLCHIGDKRASEPILKFLLNHPIISYNPEQFSYYEEIEKIFGIYGNIIFLLIRIRYKNLGSMDNADYKYEMEIPVTIVQKLTRKFTKISNNILNLITQMKDIEVITGTSCTNTFYGILSFEEIRKIVSEELERRGNPPYEPSIYLIDEEWEK